jgi:MoxR-like ATPase
MESKNVQNGTPVQNQTQAFSQPSSAPSFDLGAVRAKIQQLEKTLNMLVPGHDQMVRGLILGLAAGEHVVVVGPPGIAKSYAIRMLSQLIGAKFYSYLLTKFTSYDEIFGAIDVAELAKGNFKRRFSDIISADIVFLDEVFKANSAVLNSLLSLMQERVVYDPMSGTAVPANLHVLIGASNEVPSDEELAALFDRFAIKIYEDYLQKEEVFVEALKARWAGNGGAVTTAVVTMQEVRWLASVVQSMLAVNVQDMGEPLYKVYAGHAIPFVKELRSKGVLVSDRYVIEKLPKLYATYLVIYGFTAENIVSAVYELVKYVARSRQELADVKKYVDEAMGEVGELARLLDEGKRLAAAGDVKNAKERFMAVINFDLSKIEKKPWLKPRVEAIIATARDYMNQLLEIERSLKRLADE